ncbi:MAG: family 10 glycosylhydrolase, partial [Candidatus Krumholzibacteriota bacterium]|nr:family 10 glycosylhydrolase [Candidatus Krumholzibacteriota bacterium]
AHDTSGGKARLDVYAWFNVFKLGEQKDYLESIPAPIVVSHPEWLTRDATGEVTTALDPGVPAVQDYVIKIIEDCLKRYKVDGVNLDFIRYFSRDSGYNPIALERFRRRTGRSELPAEEDEAWSDFRREVSRQRNLHVSDRATRPAAVYRIF